jgi:predicted RNase H-like HicB family nuclease
MNYHFKIHKEANNLWAECIELNSCYTSGSNLDELKKNAIESLNLHLSEPENSKQIFPFPDNKIKNTNTIISAHVDPSVGFSFVLRMLRLRRKWTQSFVARKLKYSSVNAYAKLEKPNANPQLKTLSNLVNIFPELRKYEFY